MKRQKERNREGDTDTGEETVGDIENERDRRAETEEEKQIGKPRGKYVRGREIEWETMDKRHRDYCGKADRGGADRGGSEREGRCCTHILIIVAKNPFLK
jgi:hypothetical protein